jgi:hypothetical protein
MSFTIARESSLQLLACLSTSCLGSFQLACKPTILSST